MTDGVLRFERDPGMEMGYSGEGLLYLVRFMENKLGQPFNDIAEEVLFGPERMGNSAFGNQDWYEGRLAWPYFPDGQWRRPVRFDNAIGVGELRTTTADFASFLISIMNSNKVSE